MSSNEPSSKWTWTMVCIASLCCVNVKPLRGEVPPSLCCLPVDALLTLSSLPTSTSLPQTCPACGTGT